MYRLKDHDRLRVDKLLLMLDQQQQMCQGIAVGQLCRDVATTILQYVLEQSVASLGEVCAGLQLLVVVH